MCLATDEKEKNKMTDGEMIAKAIEDMNEDITNQLDVISDVMLDKYWMVKIREIDYDGLINEFCERLWDDDTGTYDLDGVVLADYLKDFADALVDALRHENRG